MEKYKLKKDTLLYKPGTICVLTQKGNLVLDGNRGTCVLSKHSLERHPELLDEWFEKVEEKKYGGRVPKEGDKYWYIFADGTIAEDFWNGLRGEKARFESGSAFWTFEEAEKELKRRKAYVILKEDTKGFVPDWEIYNTEKNCVCYDHDKKHLITDYNFSYQKGLIYFATKADAEASIRTHRKEWLDYLGVEEEE